MKFNQLAKPLFFLSAILVFVFLFNVVVSAQSIRPGAKRATASATLKKARLESTKLRVCENRQEIIKRRSERIATRANLIQNRFDRITTRVEDFYTNKVIPGGGTVENYNVLVTDIASKKATVAEKVALAKAAAAAFDCKGDDPKGQLKEFREDMAGVIASLQEYKKSIIKLLVAVRTEGKKLKTATSSATP